MTDTAAAASQWMDPDSGGDSPPADTRLLAALQERLAAQVVWSAIERHVDDDDAPAEVAVMAVTVSDDGVVALCAYDAEDDDAFVSGRVSGFNAAIPAEIPDVLRAAHVYARLHRDRAAPEHDHPTENTAP